jgi:hypothetical protein
MLAAPSAKGDSRADPSSHVCPIVNTFTTCMLGAFSVRVGAKLMAIMVILDGLMSVLTWVVDCRNPATVMFRWGAPGWEARLQNVNAAVGICSMLAGVAALGSINRPDLPHLEGLRRFKNYVLILMVWTVSWFLLVGLPVDVVYVSVPVIQAWPVSVLPGVPHYDIVDPAWPNGRPSVCTDVAEAKQTLAHILTKNRKNRNIARVLHGVYTWVIHRYSPVCRQIQKIFWLVMLFSLCWRAYAVYLIEHFCKCVKHGGNGTVMIGQLEDLDKPIDIQEHMRSHIEQIFNQMDADHDGKVSLSELRDYLKNTSSLYSNLATA